VTTLRERMTTYEGIPMDERCEAARRYGETGDEAEHDRANRYDTERAWTLAIAILREDDAAQEHLQWEIGDCPDCLRGWTKASAGLLTGLLRDQIRVTLPNEDTTELAVKVAQYLLDDVRNARSIFDDPPPE
jgi:hypothetical protein